MTDMGTQQPDPVKPLTPGTDGLQPLPYHVELRDYLKAAERDLWNWFSSAQVRSDYAESLRLNLLKSSYRLDPEGHPDLRNIVEEAKARLQLDIPVTLYQAQQGGAANAMLCFVPGEGHLVFSGSLLSLVSPEELRSVIGHELAHYQLWQMDGGEYHVADLLLQAVANDPRAAASHLQSARWYQLYTEIFADRGSLRVTGNLHTVVSGLIKTQTGLTQVSAVSYLKQADEIFQKGSVGTEELSHPEAFIRARALALWESGGEKADPAISAMIEGAASLEALDLAGQVRWSRLTRQVLAALLRPKWFQTDAVLGHARLFFADFKPGLPVEVAWMEDLKTADPKLRDYIGYLLLDFAVADPELDEMPLAAALELSRQLGLESLFEKMVTRELKVKGRELKRLKQEAAALLAKAEQTA